MPFFDGVTHWALTPRGVVTWTGPAIDPPSNAVVQRPAQDPPTIPVNTRPGLDSTTPANGTDDASPLWLLLLVFVALLLVFRHRVPGRRKRRTDGDMLVSIALWVLLSPVHLIAALVSLHSRWAGVSCNKALRELRVMDPVAFENWVAQRFRELGYSVKTTKTTGDHGIDLVVHKGPVFGVVQCKRWGGVVGEPILRDLYGAMHDRRAGRAFLVTTGDFTAAARHWAEGKPIELWDGDRLTQLATR